MKPKEFNNLPMRDVSGGMMSAVEDTYIPDAACRLSLGFRYDHIGRAKQREGYTKLGGLVSATTSDGLTGFVNAAGTLNRVVTAYGGTNYAYDGSAWYNIGGGMVSGTRVRYASMLDRVFRVGGGADTKSWNGQTASTFDTTQLSGAPNGSLIQSFKSKLYIAGNSTYPDRLFFSTIPDVSGNIDWAQSTQYLDVNPADGDNITALMKTGTQMLIFKKDFIYRWNGTSTDAEPVINVGTISQETVANCNGMIIFFHPKGVFMTDGGIPVEISRPINNFIEAIPASNYSSMCAYADKDRFGLFCGDVTVDGRVFSNLVLEYDVNIKAWQPHVLAHSFRVFATVHDSAGAEFIAGAKSSYVESMFSGNTDDGEPIVFERETRRMDFDGLYTQKRLNDFSFYLSGAPGSLFEGLPHNENGDKLDPVTIGSSQEGQVIVKGKDVRGNKISFKISGTNRGTPAEWRGFDILAGRSMGMIYRTNSNFSAIPTPAPAATVYRITPEGDLRVTPESYTRSVYA